MIYCHVLFFLASTLIDTVNYGQISSKRYAKQYAGNWQKLTVIQSEDRMSLKNTWGVDGWWFREEA